MSSVFSRAPHTILGWLAAAAAMIAPLSATYAKSPEVSIQFDEPIVGQDDAGFGDVYGQVQYSVGKPFFYDDKAAKFVDYKSVDRAITSGMGGLAQVLKEFFGGTSNVTFVLTLEVENKAASKHRYAEPLVTISSAHTNFVFMEMSRKQLVEKIQARTLLEYYPVLAKTNKLQVSLRAHRIAEEVVDLSVVRSLYELRNKASGVSFLPQATGALGEFITLFEGTMKKLFDRTEDVATQNSKELRFISLNSGTSPSQIRIILKIDNARVFNTKGDLTDDTAQVMVPITVTFSTQDTRLRIRVKNNEIERADLATIIDNTRLGPYDDDELLFDSLRTSKDHLMRLFLDSLVQQGMFKRPTSGDGGNYDAGAGCTSFFGKVGDFLTSRDAAVYYCGFLNKFHTQLAKSDSPATCLDKAKKDALHEFGLTFTAFGGDFVCKLNGGDDKDAKSFKIIGKSGVPIAEGGRAFRRGDRVEVPVTSGADRRRDKGKVIPLLGVDID